MLQGPIRPGMEAEGHRDAEGPVFFGDAKGELPCIST